ncbi:glycosyltransferase family 2 protein [Candidatus Curtissbacteria bacterium]|nr:glycosyltransferase family 2 protein [Candidatus Curtissbacteria bacterium]
MKNTTSVIIPAYNEEASIGDCLTSLQGQSLKSDEIIVVDDGSTDKTVNIIEKLSVKLFKQNHLGPGSARNLGAKEAKGDILVFVDADMTFDKDFIKNLTAPISSGKTKGVFNTDELVANWTSPWARCWNYNQNLYTKARMDPKSHHESEDFRAILKKEFDRVGGFDLTGYTDSRTLVKKLGFRPTSVEDAVSYHKNPEILREIFSQARWIGRRRTRFGIIGKFLNLIHYSLPYSLAVGFIKSVKTGEFRFIIFKIIYDLGFSVGTLDSLLTGKTAK